MGTAGMPAVLALTLVLTMACTRTQAGYLVSTPEVRDVFGVPEDTLPEIVSGPTVAAAARATVSALEPLGVIAQVACVRVFRSSAGVVAYGGSNCVGATSPRPVADGDGLVLLSPGGDSVRAIILAPGGIEIHPDD